MTARSVTNCARQTMRWLASEGLIELSGAGQTASSYHCRPGRRRARGQAIGRPKALDKSKAALARRMHASGEPVSTIAATLGVSRATVYRVLGKQDDDSRAPAGPRRKSAKPRTAPKNL